MSFSERIGMAGSSRYPKEVPVVVLYESKPISHSSSQKEKEEKKTMIIRIINSVANCFFCGKSRHK